MVNTCQTYVKIYAFNPIGRMLIRPLLMLVMGFKLKKFTYLIYLRNLRAIGRTGFQ